MNDTSNGTERNHIALKRLTPALLLMTTTLAVAEPARFEGQLEGYGGPASTVLAGLMMPFEAGEVDDSGHFTIVLDETFMEKNLAAVEEQNASGRGWSTELATVERAFGCDGGDITISGGDQVVTSLFGAGWLMVGSMEEQVLYGRFAAADSRTFAETSGAINKDAVPGWSVDWYYFESPAGVQGTCTTRWYGSDEYAATTEYDLAFEPGWNLVRYQVQSVKEHPDGVNRSERVKVETIDAMPDGVVFPFVEDRG